MELHGKNLVASRIVADGTVTLVGENPTTGERLEPEFHEATETEVDRAVDTAADATDPYRRVDPERRAAFLDEIAARIEGLGDTLLERTEAETALPRPRLTGERGRTTGQLRLFAEVVREGSWVEARIDRALPEREPLPRPDLRRLLVPLGPVAVFGASNFPLAFSVAGGDTASALAAGCPVVVKAHPAHPGASEMVARVILEAAEETGMPSGVFSMVHGASHSVGERLVKHPSIAAVAFTGSMRGGRALFDLAASRPAPIPVYAEMGSSNPVFVLPGALEERGSEIARGLAGSVSLGAGQFCTNPGLTILPSNGSGGFESDLAEQVESTPVGTMATAGISAAYEQALDEVSEITGVEVLARPQAPDSRAETSARPALLRTDASTYGTHERLGHEIYGPSTVMVSCGSHDEMVELARGLHGHLTATVHGTQADFEEHADLVEVLQSKVGRLVFNGFPTGVEVSPAMQHGGPYPATTDSRATSVGTAAIQRFVRPVCWQDAPAELLPAELADDNPRRIWRLVDGELTREAV